MYKAKNNWVGTYDALMMLLEQTGDSRQQNGFFFRIKNASNDISSFGIQKLLLFINVFGPILWHLSQTMPL